MSAPPPAEPMVERAVALHRAGRLGQAEALYRAAIALAPQQPEANHNLGVLLVQRGDPEAALAYLQAALACDPSRETYWLSCARALMVCGRRSDAAGVLARARARGHSGPAMAALLAQAGAGDPAAEAEAELRRADTLAELGDLDGAVAGYREALRLDPHLAEAHHHLGSVLSETGRVADGFAHLMRRAELVRGGDDPTAGGQTGPAHKRKHDREQRAYLEARSLVRPDAPDPVFHLAAGPRLAGPAVDPAAATPALIAAWRQAQPRMVVIDDFLTPDALDGLRTYCAESTVWRRIYDAGYLGATPHDGFACPLLAQIAEDIPRVYADLIGDHAFAYLGGFKYDSELSRGTNTHADLSAINVNLYIAPEEANLDPETGGMLIWDVEATDEAEMRRFNSDEAGLQAHLARRGATVTRTPHRANRAVIFKSGLYHRTDVCRFRDGYLQKRINVSLLYGRFGAPGD